MKTNNRHAWRTLTVGTGIVLVCPAVAFLGLVWFTHFSNDPSVKAPDRTIDYIFMPRSLSLIEHHVRQHDTLRLSDHFPVVAVVKIP